MNKKILFYLFILFTQVSLAKDIYVSADGSNSNGGTSLADAVADLKTAFEKSAHDDVIYVDGTAGTIYNPVAFGIAKRLTIIGQNNAIIDAKLEDGSRNKIFNYTHKTDDATLSIENITFLNGDGNFNGAAQQGGGFLINSTGVLTFKNCNFKGHTAPKHGGVFAIQQGTVNFEGCVFEENTLASSNGGVIYSECTLPVEINISECLFYKNAVDSHGGAIALIFKVPDSNSKKLSIKNSTFYQNSVGLTGGMLYVSDAGAGVVELENVTVVENTTQGNADNCGGLKFNNPNVSYLIENSLIYENKTFANGEAISDLSMHDDASITIKSSIFGAILKNDIVIIEDTSNPKTSVDEKSVYGSITSATNENVPDITLTYNAEIGVVSFASDALPVNFADASLLSGSEGHSLLTDQLGLVRRVVNNAVDAGAYQLDAVASVTEVLNDNTPPTDPSNIVFSSITETSFEASWDASTDDVMFGHYEVQLNDNPTVVTTDLSLTFNDLTANTDYTVKVKALDYNGNTSQVVQANQTTAGKVVPVVPTDLKADNITSTTAELSWASTVDAGLMYVITVGTEEFTTAVLEYKLENLEPATEYTVTVKSKNADGEESLESTPVKFTTSSYIPQTYYVRADGLEENDGLGPDTALPTLLLAYNKAVDGDVIIIDGVLDYSKSMGIQKNLTIKGINNATLDAKGTVKFFNIANPEEGSYLTLENIHFKNGNGSYNGTSNQIGGALLINSPAVVTISGCTFEGNSASLNGGVIAIQKGELRIKKSVFDNNSTISDGGSTPSGGVIFLSATTNSTKLSIDQSAFKNNNSANHGGVLHVETNASNGHTFDISIENSTIYGNQTANAGGAMFFGNKGAGTLNMVNVTIANNKTTSNGVNSGGVRCINEDLVTTINNTLIFDNKSNFGLGTEVMSDLSTNKSANFTLNHSIVGAIVVTDVELLKGANNLYGEVSGSTNTNVPAITLDPINEHNVVAFAADALPVDFGMASLLSAKPTHGAFKVDQLDNVRTVVDGKIDCGAYQINGVANIDDVLNDTEAPSAVTNILFSEVTFNSFEVAWNASTDNVGMSHYMIQLNEESPVKVMGTSYKFEELMAETDYVVKVSAVDLAGNTSQQASETIKTDEAPSSFPTPVVPADVKVDLITQTEATVTWADPEVAGLSFEVMIGDDMYETTDFTYKIEGLTANTKYEVTVLSKNENNEKSVASDAVEFTTLEEESQEPKTLYVSAGGDDTQDGLTESTALASLNKAIELSNAKDKIIINGTIVHTQTVIINKQLTLEGLNNATIDAGNTSKIFTFTDGTEGTSLVVENIKFINANGMTDGVAEVGGAISMSSVGELKFMNCSFENNSSSRPGGALGIQNGTVNIYGSSFINNSTVKVGDDSPNGGAILITSGSNDVFLNVYESYFKGNSSVNHGGAITMEVTANTNNVFMQNTTIADNSAANAGGAIFIGNQGNGLLKLENVTVSGNSNTANSGNSGGIRIVNTSIDVQVNNSLIAHNLSNYGTNNEVYSDFSIGLNPNVTVNSSIITAVVVSDKHGTINTDDNVQYGTVEGTALENTPEIVLEAINENGVIGFSPEALAAGFAKSALMTGSDEHNLLVDQLGLVRALRNGRIDCGAYQLDGKYDLATVLTDNANPTAVSDLKISKLEVKSLEIEWIAATDDIGLSFYTLTLNDGEDIFVNPEATSYTFGGLEPETAYTVKVIAHDFAGKQSEVQEVSGTTESVPDEYPTPIVPTNVTVKDITKTSATVTWDDLQVDGLSYIVILGDKTYASDNNSITIEDLTEGTSYTVSVVSVNIVEEQSAPSEAVNFTTDEDTGTDPNAKEIFVSATGDNNNDGLSLDNAVVDLITAYNLANDGDKIIIDGAVEHKVFLGISKQLEIIGQNNASLDAGNATKFFNFTGETNEASLVIENIHFKNANGVVDGVAQLGGAILINTEGKLVIRNCTFENNATTKSGGALAIQSGTVDIIASSLIGNEVISEGDGKPSGGAIVVNSNSAEVNLNIYQSLIKDNVSATHGGAIIIESTNNPNNVFIQNSTIYNNSTVNAGGAIFAGNQGAGKLILENNTITKNYTLNNTGNCGGIRVVNLNLDIVINNSIVYDNKSNFGVANEVVSDLSIGLTDKAVVNSSILGTLVESNSNGTFTGDGRTKYGTVAGTTTADIPVLSLLDIDERGVVGFATNALPVAFAKVELYTRSESHNFLADQLDYLRISKEGYIDCGAYQLDGTVKVSDIENDKEAPTVPTNITFPIVTPNAITIKWDASTDDVAVSHYLISINGQEPVVANSTSYTFTDLQELTLYTFTLKAVDYVNNMSEEATAQQETDGVRIPLTPKDVTVNNVTASTAQVNWTVENTKGLTYIVNLQGEWFETSETTFKLTGLDNDREYSVTIFSKNIEGDLSEESEVVFFTTLPDDVTSVDPVAGPQVKAYPNPSAQEMTVEVELSKFNVEVYDLSGRKVYGLEDVNQAFKLKLNTGVYVLRILSNEHILTKRIVFN
ncbi:fibronectin type III domain-containing protein [Flammeovirga aprica]|uniref:T9SS type A sorting domain-containing protein n=1 Tax=Flammeovirga aprica JL-4 TaxID=694437 RepID=A0A7X9RXN4_9BACT|nr:fibronectin type III domain-containing protein [Flammeovirga aprica]NME70626.1 T9SS type A sorting domain-containing protein [Flammeovirga aprica JL-4]